MQKKTTSRQNAYTVALAILQKANDWVPEHELKSKIRLQGYFDVAILQAIRKLKNTSNIGEQWNRELRRVEFRWYPWRKGFDDLNQRAIDEWVRNNW